MTAIIALLSSIILTLGLLLSGFQVEIKKNVEQVFGAIEVVDDKNCKTAAATSTLTYMTLGTATSTLTCSGFIKDAARSAVLAIVVNASSTNTFFAGGVEESMDGQDWFPITLPQAASTTNPFSLTTRGTFGFNFASSTIGGVGQGASANRLGASGGDNRNHYSYDIPVRMKRARVYMHLPIPSTWGTGLTATDTYNGAVWMQIIPKVEF